MLPRQLRITDFIHKKEQLLDSDLAAERKRIANSMYVVHLMLNVESNKVFQYPSAPIFETERIEPYYSDEIQSIWAAL